MKAAWHKSFLIIANLLCFVNVNVPKHGIFSFYHLATHVGNDLKNLGLLSPICFHENYLERIAFSNLKLSTKCSKVSESQHCYSFQGIRFNSSSRRPWIQANTNGTLCYRYPGEVLLDLISELCVNLPVVYSPFRTCNCFQDISRPSAFLRSLNFSKANAGKVKHLLFSKLFLMLFVKWTLTKKDKFFMAHTRNINYRMVC